MKSINVMLDETAFMPTRAHEEDAGLDLYTPVDFELSKIDSIKIDTGVHIEIPKGYTGFLMSKSGLNVNYGILSTGVIDSGYTGTIVVKLYRMDTYSDKVKKFKAGDKITQLVILPIETPVPVLVDYFKSTDRGDNGFGSTGT